MRQSRAHRDIPIVMMTSLPSRLPQQRDLFDAVSESRSRRTC